MLSDYNVDVHVYFQPLHDKMLDLCFPNRSFSPDQVQPEVKLPILYLIDSIVKNVGDKYKQLFAQNIVNMFCGVFEKVKKSNICDEHDKRNS